MIVSLTGLKAEGQKALALSLEHLLKGSTAAPTLASQMHTLTGTPTFLREQQHTSRPHLILSAGKYVELS